MATIDPRQAIDFLNWVIANREKEGVCQHYNTDELKIIRRYFVDLAVKQHEKEVNDAIKAKNNTVVANFVTDLPGDIDLRKA